MNKRILPLLLAAALTLTGCTALLERSYDVVEPYTNRYWDTGAEDTLRAESYQDLVNSLLMLVEERAQEGIIRYYAKNGTDAYQLALAAKQEVLEETVLGSYLLDDIVFTFTSGEAYSSMNYTITYRSNISDPDSLMSLSDTQSLVDLLRLAVRENHATLTAHFITPVEQSAVESAVESLWQELCSAEDGRDSEDADPPADTAPDTEGETPEQSGEAQAPDGEDPPAEPEPPAEGEIPDETPDGENTPGEGGQEDTPPPEEDPYEEYPPCPWKIHFYPDPSSAEIVEILLR